MKFIVYKNINTPILIVNDQFQFFHQETKKPVTQEQQQLLELKISDWTYPDLRCVNLRTGKTTSTRQLYEQNLKTDLSDPDTKNQIDQFRQSGTTEKNIADEFEVSTKTLQRRYPKRMSDIKI